MSPDIKNRPGSASTEKDSFEAIFTRYYPLVYQLAYRCVGRSDEAEDITQEVFLRYYRTPPRATSEAEQRAWLCRVATNLGLNALRAHQRRTSREEQSYAEIAQATGVASASVGALLARAEREFRRKYHERVPANG
jgi:DNA-directed RNA polymerase specialized sigma24 family protein